MSHPSQRSSRPPSPQDRPVLTFCMPGYRAPQPSIEYDPLRAFRSQAASSLPVEDDSDDDHDSAGSNASVQDAHRVASEPSDSATSFPVPTSDNTQTVRPARANDPSTWIHFDLPLYPQAAFLDAEDTDPPSPTLSESEDGPDVSSWGLWYLKFVAQTRNCAEMRRALELPAEPCSRHSPCSNCILHPGAETASSYWLMMSDEEINVHIARYGMDDSQVAAADDSDARETR